MTVVDDYDYDQWWHIYDDDADDTGDDDDADIQMI